MNWEYDILDLTGYGENVSALATKLNSMGRTGWELVCRSDRNFIFKRELDLTAPNPQKLFKDIKPIATNAALSSGWALGNDFKFHFYNYGDRSPCLETWNLTPIYAHEDISKPGFPAFCSQCHEAKAVIIVNGKSASAPFIKPIAYEDILALAGHNPDSIRSVTYHKGTSLKPEGMLSKGKSVPVAEGMIFDCYDTSRA